MSIFTPDELEGMKDCAWVLGELVRDLERSLAPGRTTKEIDTAAAALVEQYGVRAAFKGYRGYPATLTTSVNEEVIDGVPGSRALKEGDLLKLQIGVENDGFFTYWADTYPIGRVAENAARLVDATRTAARAGVSRCTAGAAIESVSGAIQDAVISAGYDIVRMYCGHGIGRRMHEEPQIPCYLDSRTPGRYRFSRGEVVALQVLTLEKPARLGPVGGGLTMSAPRGVLSAHVGVVVAVGAQPDVLLGHL